MGKQINCPIYKDRHLLKQKLTMKNLLLILLSIMLLTKCWHETQTNKELVTNYFDARQSGEFEKIKAVVNDSFTITEGDHIMPYSLDSYYEVFKWDSIFQTSYKIVKLKDVNNQVVASIDLSSIRNKFLQNDQMTCQFKISFDSGKISKIESLDCQGADWAVWQKKVNTLVSWIETNHPDLNGFIHDMSMEGANNYLKAIELFETNEKNL